MTVSWIKDKDHILRDNDNVKMFFNNNQVTFKILRALSASCGKYTCHLKNDAGSAESVATVTVLGLLKSTSLLFCSLLVFRKCYKLQTKFLSNLQNLQPYWIHQNHSV